jgi:hypothetical protein
MGLRPTFVKLTKRERKAILLDEIAEQHWFNAMSCWFEDQQMSQEEQTQWMGGNGKSPSAPKQRQVILRRMLADGLADYLYPALEAHMLFRGEYHLLKKRMADRLNHLRSWIAYPPPSNHPPGYPLAWIEEDKARRAEELLEVKADLEVVEGLARRWGWTELLKENSDA